MIGGSHSGVLEDPVLPGRYAVRLLHNSILYSGRFVLQLIFSADDIIRGLLTAKVKVRSLFNNFSLSLSPCVISGFHLGVVETFALLVC